MTHTVIVKGNLYYEGIDEEDALFNCPSNGQVVALNDDQLHNFANRRCRTSEAEEVIQEYYTWN